MVKGRLVFVLGTFDNINLQQKVKMVYLAFEMVYMVIGDLRIVYFVFCIWEFVFSICNG